MVKDKPPLATGLRFTRDRLAVLLNDGREVAVPLAWYPTLAKATRTERNDWHLLNKGQAFHWPRLDLDLSLGGIVNGLREAIPKPPRV